MMERFCAPRIRLHDKRAALVDFWKTLSSLGSRLSVNTTVVVNQQRANTDAATLKDLWLRVIENRKRAAEPPALRLVSPDPAPPVQSVPPPVEAKPQTMGSSIKTPSTTEAFLEWSKQPLKPP